ncbi:IS1595 family transposase [Ignatzschineria indica]|uniref:IS1595 family transposase n=1 Tax=Ignatzschineria indica TaxID=472583 RepID=UPI002574C80F|nr:IS1595 family transposase [Ignatzschineria indica]MDM1545389.1 IS1595 family transposase [Ignatzschineria indica]
MRKSRLSQYKQDRLIEHFVAGTTARCAAELVQVNKNTSAYYFHRLRLIIYEHQKQFENTLFEGKIEVDESYFGGIRKGKRGRGAGGKTPVFGLLKHGGMVYTKIIPDSIVYSDSFKSYNALDVSEFKHYRINHSELFVESHNHINEIENFWNQAKRHMRKFNGIPKDHFELYLKECEWRFNNSGYQNQLRQLKRLVREFMG